MTRDCGHHVYEINLLVSRLAVHYRMEWPVEVDEDLHLAVQTLGDMLNRALLDVFSASILWRAGELVRAREHARRSVTGWLQARYMGPAVAAASLALYLTHQLGEGGEPPEAGAVAGAGPRV